MPEDLVKDTDFVLLLFVDLTAFYCYSSAAPAMCVLWQRVNNFRNVDICPMFL